MPRKINLEVESPVVAPVIKPKREISESQREHLNKIRTLAMAKKAESKEITLKSNTQSRDRHEILVRFTPFLLPAFTEVQLWTL